MGPRHADAKPRPPGDFSGVLATDEPVLLVGGQAVNLWALYYHERTADLEPFVSHDLDVLGTSETLEMLARLAGTKPQFFPMRPPSNEIGVVIAKDRSGQSMLVEVLRSVNGVDNEALNAGAHVVALGDVQVRIPNPIVLLQAKVANVVELNQAERQDARHVLILTRVMPAYLADLQEVVVAGRIKERAMINLLEQLLGVISSDHGRKVLAQLGVKGRSLFAGLESSGLSKLQAFVEKRLARALPPK